MFGTQEMIQYLRFLRHKEELDILIKKFLLNKKCLDCGFEYTTIEDIYTRLPVVSYALEKDDSSLPLSYNLNLVCNSCVEKFINKMIEVNKKT